MKNHEVEKLIKIENVVLTSTGLKRLSTYQKSGEIGIDGVRERLADAVCFFK